MPATTNTSQDGAAAHAAQPADRQAVAHLCGVRGLLTWLGAASALTSGAAMLAVQVQLPMAAASMLAGAGLCALGAAAHVWRRRTMLAGKVTSEDAAVATPQAMHTGLSLQHLAQMTGQGVLRVNAFGTVLDAAGLDAASFAGNELPAMADLVQLTNVADRPAMLMALAQSANGPVNVAVRLRLNPAISFEQVNLRLVADGDGRIVLIGQDHLPRAEAGDRADLRAVAEFAHDVRAPLAAMINLAEALGDDAVCTTAMQTEYPALIAATARDMLDFAGSCFAPEDGAQPVPTEQLGTIVPRVIRTLAAASAAKNASIFNRIPAHLSARNVPAVALRRMLQNLIGNAIAHGGNGVSVEISGALSDTGWSVSVSDNGPGMPRGIMNPLSETPTQASVKLGMAPHGHGLAIVRRLAQEAGGRFALRSRAGEGTTITLSFPLASPLTSPFAKDGRIARPDFGMSVNHEVELNGLVKRSA